MKLADFDTGPASEKGVKVTLKHPVTGVQLDASITVYGQDSDRYREKRMEIQRRRLDESAAGVPDKDPVTRTQSEATELLAHMTAGWEGIEGDSGALAFSEAEARRLYERAGLRWIREQVDEAIHTRALFMPGGASN